MGKRNILDSEIHLHSAALYKAKPETLFVKSRKMLRLAWPGQWSCWGDFDGFFADFRSDPAHRRPILAGATLQSDHTTRSVNVIRSPFDAKRQKVWLARRKFTKMRFFAYFGNIHHFLGFCSLLRLPRIAVGKRLPCAAKWMTVEPKGKKVMRLAGQDKCFLNTIPSFLKSEFHNGKT